MPNPNPARQRVGGHLAPRPTPLHAPWQRACIGGALLSAVGLLLALVWLRSAETGALPKLPPHVVLAYGLCLLTGGIAGLLSGLLGIGGSLIVVPALYVLLPWLDVAPAQLPQTAVATALAVMLPSALGATLAQHRAGRLPLAWLRRLAPAMTLGAAAGAVLAQHIHGPLLALLFVLQSFYYGLGMLRSRPPAPSGVRARIAALCARLRPAGMAAPTGAFCACVGMGGSSLVVPYLLLRGAGVLQASAASGALNLCIAAGGALAFAALPGAAAGQGATCWPAALLMGGAAALAVPLGVAGAGRIPAAQFRRLLGIVNLLGGAVLLWRTVSGA